MPRELVIRATHGDQEAFATLASAAFDRLFRTARLILRDDDQAEDAVQEALLAAWLHIRAVRDPDRFDAWLHRLVVHACYGEGRRSKRRRIREIRVAPLDERDGLDVEGASAMRDQLDRAFQDLTLEHRAVLVAHHYLGLPDADAAAALGIPVGTYKSRLNRAGRSLRAAVEADDRRPGLTQESIA
jgi:RNA polymerase sigma factor (sigma-70 family)